MQVARRVADIFGEGLFAVSHDGIANTTHMHAQPFSSGGTVAVISRAVGMDTPCVEQGIILCKLRFAIGIMNGIGLPSARLYD